MLGSGIVWVTYLQSGAHQTQPFSFHLGKVVNIFVHPFFMGKMRIMKNAYPIVLLQRLSEGCLQTAQHSLKHSTGLLDVASVDG